MPVSEAEPVAFSAIAAFFAACMTVWALRSRHWSLCTSYGLISALSVALVVIHSLRPKLNDLVYHQITSVLGCSTASLLSSSELQPLWELYVAQLSNRYIQYKQFINPFKWGIYIICSIKIVLAIVFRILRPSQRSFLEAFLLECIFEYILSPPLRYAIRGPSFSSISLVLTCVSCSIVVISTFILLGFGWSNRDTDMIALSLRVYILLGCLLATRSLVYWAFRPSHAVLGSDTSSIKEGSKELLYSPPQSAQSLQPIYGTPRPVINIRHDDFLNPEEPPQTNGAQPLQPIHGTPRPVINIRHDHFLNPEEPPQTNCAQPLQPIHGTPRPVINIRHDDFLNPKEPPQPNCLDCHRNRMKYKSANGSTISRCATCYEVVAIKEKDNPFLADQTLERFPVVSHLTRH